MSPVSIQEAQRHLPELIDEATSGIDVVIVTNGRPVARLVPIRPRRPLVFGSMAGAIRVAEDFDDSLPEDMAKTFGGR